MASRVVRARLDERAEQALNTLMQEGRNESEAVRAALVEAGTTRRRRSNLALEAARLAQDVDDVREQQAVLSDMDALGIDWPE